MREAADCLNSPGKTKVVPKRASETETAEFSLGTPKCSDDSKTKTSELYTLNLIYSMGLKSYVNIFGLVG